MIKAYVMQGEKAMQGIVYTIISIIAMIITMIYMQLIGMYMTLIYQKSG